MTLDELNIAITVSADDALNKLDEIIMKARAIGALLGDSAGASGGGVLKAGEAVNALADGVAAGGTRIAEGLNGGAEAIAAFVAGLSEAAHSAREGDGALEGLGSRLELPQAGDAAHSVSALGSELSNAAAEAIGMANAAQDMERRFSAMSAVKRNIQSFRELCAQYKRAAREGGGTAASFDKLKAAAGKLGLSVEDSGESVDDCREHVDALERALDDDAKSMAVSLGDMLTRARQVEAGLNVQAAMGVDVSQPLGAIQAVIGVINALLSLMGKAGISTGGGSSGGGGGGSKKDKAEEARKAAEEARKERLRSYYELIEHQRHMNEITLEQELQMLEQIRENHQITAEEIMEWEEKVFDLRKELRERDAESIDTLTNGVVDALTARYEAMRDAELKRLDDSREAWEAWRDDSVKAINDQIAALDELAETEDREAADQKELRKIASLRQQIEFEQDAYNRAKLNEQLEAALESRSERLRRLSLQDQKQALQEEIERIGERTDAELSALDKEREAIEQAYGERLKQASLEAEAQKLLMTSTQSELLNLLGEYAPEYDALGQSFGERLYEGFKAKAGGIAEWFGSFNAQMAAVQAGIAESMNAATDAFYAGQQKNGGKGVLGATVGSGVTINQTTNINQPVETPSEYAYRMRRINEELAETVIREGS